MDVLHHLQQYISDILWQSVLFKWKKLEIVLRKQLTFHNSVNDKLDHIKLYQVHTPHHG
jgi:hypothetical protein